MPGLLMYEQDVWLFIVAALVVTLVAVALILQWVYG